VDEEITTINSRTEPKNTTFTTEKGQKQARTTTMKFNSLESRELQTETQKSGNSNKARHNDGSGTLPVSLSGPIANPTT
jgi:hypothetical protein